MSKQSLRAGPSRGSAAIRLLSLLAGLLALGFADCIAADNRASEYQVKAAFLLNFTKFIEWPAPGPLIPDSTFNICVLGEDPFRQTLDSMVEGETVGSRRVVIRRSQREVPNSCQVLFIGTIDKDTPKALAGLGTGVLTVGEGRRFLGAGGMIAFVVDNRHVRFDVNQKAAENAGLKLSSQLLNVARSVER